MRPWIVASITVAALLFAAVPAEATVPGQNGRIAFESNRDGNYEIYTIEPDGSGLNRLTNDPAQDTDPAWSPDGSRLAFSSLRTGFAEIYTMNADGTGLRRVTNHAAAAIQPTWSPDGTKIAFSSSKGGAFNLYTINADGTGETRLTDSDPIAYLSADEWSPDGSRIAYTSGFYLRFSFPSVFTIKPDGTDNKWLVSGSSATWSPDGAAVTFSRSINRGLDPFSYQDDIFRISSDGTGETSLTSTDTIDEFFPSWSPDGSSIAFSGNGGGGEISVMNADGTGTRNLTNTPTSRDIDPAWQPLVGPQRGDYKNAAQFCKAEREFLGDAAFRNRFGGGANAHGKCVSSAPH